jgi:hypothetical protein
MEVGHRGADPGSETTSDKTGKVPYRKIIALLVVVILILGSVAVYQLSQLSALSSEVSVQSAQLTQLSHPSSDMLVANFTVTKLNATSKPVMFLVLMNNGTTPAGSGDFLLGVSGGTTFQSCYNSTQNFFPIFANESVEIIVPLICGDFGKTAVLTATINFLTSHGSVTKTYYAQTTIEQSKFPLPSTVVLNQIGIWTVIVAQDFQGTIVYEWYLSLTNESPTPIVSVNASATSPRGDVFAEQGCVSFGPNFYSVSPSHPPSLP